MQSAEQSLELIGFDLETSGSKPEFALQPWRPRSEFWLTGMAVMRRREPKGWLTYGGLDTTPEELRAFLRGAARPGTAIVGWNLVFDLAVCHAYGLREEIMACRWLDAMLLWRHATVEPEYDTTRAKRRSYSLENAIAQYYPQLLAFKEDVDFHDTSPEGRKRLWQRNVIDAMTSVLMAEKCLKALTPTQLSAAFYEAEALPLIAESNLAGLTIDILTARQLERHLTGEAAKALEDLAPHGVTEAIVRSPKQLADLMFERWGLPVHKMTKTGQRATDKESLFELGFKDERARTLRRYREALNNRTKFATTPLKAAAYNSGLQAHPLAIPFGTYSGRLTYASKQGKGKGACPIGFALHQMKNDKKYRSIVVAPPGHMIVEFDAAGQEYRIMAILSGDPTMRELCEPGEDGHSYLGAAIARCDYRELIVRVKAEEPAATLIRKAGKVGNLSLQYRTSPKRFRIMARVQYDLMLELRQAEVIHTTYRRIYVRVPVYWINIVQTTKRRGYAETLAGRRVQVQGDWSGVDAWSLESTAINYPIQGTGADMKFLALRVLKPYTTRYNVRFAFDLHDGLYFYVPENMANDFIRRAKEQLDHLPYKEAWSFVPPVPLPWDVKVGPSWGQLKPWSE